MKATFPHMGTAYLSFSTMLADLGLEPVIPPRITQRTLSLGVQHAPEFACFPLKVNLGNYLEAISAGAEVIFMAGGVGPCRLGYYAEVQREILRDLVRDFELIALEPPNHRLRELWQAVHRVLPRVSPARVLRAVGFCIRKIGAVDRLEMAVNRIRPRELRRGDVDAAWRECQRRLLPVNDTVGLRRVEEECRALLEQVPIDPDRSLLRVALGGEVYMVLEPAVNLEIERQLGEQGVEVARQIFLSKWISDQIVKSFVSRRWFEPVRQLARPYLGNFVGGHGLESVAQAVDAGVNRLDGFIHISPFTCMPEIMAQSVLPAVRQRFNLPMLTLILDEHTGEAGVRTRLEAFLDLLARRRQKEADVHAAMLSRR